MSVEAITWALRQPISHSSAKFVLVVLANCASAERAHAWPSVAYLASATGQDRKTVLANLQRLQSWGLIEDTGKRVGDTKQIVVYKLICGPDLFAEAAGGTVPKTEQSQKRNSPENSPKQSRFSREESQKRDTEPSITNKNPNSSAQRFALRFNEWWAVYPKRVGKEPCRKKWRAKGLDELADQLIADVRNRMANDGRWLEGFIPDPLTYLGQQRWEDDVQPRRGAAAPGVASAAASRPPEKDWRKSSEDRRDNEIQHIRNQFTFGAYGEGPEAEAQRDRLIAAAHARYPTSEEPVDA